ncbi:hypothetical protein G9A89_013140 [Geosiphon pyriformis]|nr:hypothetical protein G9A89_013140 [Geosiphon pyriformis]
MELKFEILATYFQELNYNIIKYCEEKYPVQSKYSFDFKLETETGNKSKQKVKQHSKTTPNTRILPKTTAKHLQTSEQRTSVKLPLFIIPFPILLARPQTLNSPLNCFFRPENFQSPRNSTQQQELISTSTNIIEYLQKNKSDHLKNLENKEIESEQRKATENKEEMATAYIAKIPEFMGENNDTSPQEWLDKVQKTGDANGWIAAKMLKFIAGLKNKLIKKVYLHAPADLATAIRHAKSYEMAMEEANHTKLVNLAIEETSLAAKEKIDQLTKKILTTITMQPKQFWITIQQPISKLSLLWNSRTLEMRLSNQCYSLPQQSYYQSPPPTYYSPRPQNQNYYPPAPQSIQQQYQQPLPIQPYQTPSTQQYQVSARRLQRPNYYHTQLSYLTIPEKSDFQQTALFENKVAVLRSNPSNHTIPPAQIAQNANLSDIFPFKFKANKSPFLLSNAAVNEQKTITAMYTEATVEGKPIYLILDSESAGSIITYQLMQQLKQNVDRPVQTVIVTTDDMKKTPVGEIDDFLFSIDEIIIPVKSEMIGQYTIVPATCGTFNKQSEKAPVFEFEKEKEIPLTETYMAFGSTSNWAEETEQEIFEESRGWKKVRYSTPEPQKQPPYISFKCKDCNKKLSSMGAYISPEEKYETRTCYFCKACHRKRFGSPKRKECNWIDVAIRKGVCDQTCQYTLLISEKVRRRTPFDAAYNSALNKLYHYPHDAEIIFDLAMALINGAT